MAKKNKSRNRAGASRSIRSVRTRNRGMSMLTKVGLVIIAILVIVLLVYYFNNKNKISATFSCADNKTIKVVFNTGHEGSVDLTLSDGRKMNLPVTASAGGARYANKSESVVFWNTGNTAHLDENNKTTFSGCVQE